MITTNYEVYVLDRSRGWVLHARFNGSQREEAVEEGKQMERSGFKVRVARENYNSDDNTYEESDIFVARGGAAAVAAAQNASGSANGVPPRMGGPGPRGAAPRKGAKKREAAFDPKKALAEVGEAARGLINSKSFLYISMVALVGVAAGGVAVYALPQILTWAWHMGYQLNLTADAYNQLLWAAFGAAFLIVTVPLGISLLPKMNRPPMAEDDGAGAGPAPVKMDRAAYQQRVRESLDDLSRKALMGDIPDDLDDLPAQPESPPEPTFDYTPPSDEPAPTAAEPAEKSSESVSDIKVAMNLRKFVEGAIGSVKTTRTELDTYNKFALHLYVAGGVEILADANNLVASDRRRMTAEALGTLGTHGAMAEHFYDKVRDYTVEERYKRMVDLGRNAMSDFLKGAEASAHGQLSGAIQEWNHGARATKGGDLVTLMFTDMVGSTDMTQDRGDVAAQEIVRRHNTIVRMALSQFGGREIKHTGDGIMASFDDATGAIDATISIQRNVSAHNAARPDQPLHLRIGLNAGKPIREENDMFGATVQLAARVCAATQSDQTLCTVSVRDASQGRTQILNPVGAHALKGFKDPIPLLEVKW